MPRYLFEIGDVDAAVLDSAIRLAATRFPEIGLEQRYVMHDGVLRRALWVCCAPSVAHIDRWVVAAGLPSSSPRQIQADTTTLSEGDRP